jgi:aminoglycoside phosphotransferase (APT) family kinase protein
MQTSDAAREAVLRAVLSRAPGMADILRAPYRVTQLPGLTNATFRIDTAGGSFAVQLPRNAMAGGAARGAAIAATRLADALGIGAPVVHAEADTGAIVTRWAVDAFPATAERLRRTPGALAAVAACFARLHGSGARLARRFDPLAAIADLAARAAADALSPALLAGLARARSEFARFASDAVPIHGDPVPANLLATPSGIVLIDWDYAGMGDPAWDIAYFALEAGLTAAEEQALAAAHGAPGLGPRRLMLNRMTAAALAALWGMDRMRSQPVPDLTSWIAARREHGVAIATTLYGSDGSG